MGRWKKVTEDKRTESGKVVVPLSVEDRKELERLAPLKISCSEIGRVLGRSKYVVLKEYSYAGGREFYNAEKSVKDSEERRKRQGEANKIAFTNEQLERGKQMFASKCSMSEVRKELRLSFPRFQRFLRELGMKSLNVMSVLEDLESAVEMIRGQIQMIMEIIEEKK